MSDRLAWALDLNIASVPKDTEPTIHRAVEAGADRTEWMKEGFVLVAELRDAMHGVKDADSIPESPSERWQAEGQYLEFLAVSKSRLPPLSAWLKGHPEAGRELARDSSTPTRSRTPNP